MVKTVRDLISKLKQFPPDTQIVIRKGEGDGYFSDWIMHSPWQPEQDSEVIISAFEPATHFVKKGSNG